jgi:transcriptional regulator with XRE-family HTH domain
MQTIPARGAFGVLLKQYRMRAGLAQEELAERAGLSRRGISDLERGERRSPHPATVRRLVDALNLGLAEREALGTPLPALDGELRERRLQTARLMLGEDAAARAQAEGQAMSLEQAIQYALRQ